MNPKTNIIIDTLTKRFNDLEARWETRFTEFDDKWESRFSESDDKWKRRFADLKVS